MLREAEQLGAAAVGFNCVGAGETTPALVAKLRRSVRSPILSKPNAGMPAPGPTGKPVYPMGPEEFAAIQVQAAEMGAALLGGCCGTDPACIRSLSQALKKTR